MRIVPSRALASLLVSAVACLGSACGGGSSDATPTLPGTLTALALEGLPAPGTSGGTYGAFAAAAQISAADGGWTAFVATVVGGDTPKALFVATPGGTVTRVFAVGDAVPAPGTGVIADFTRIFMRPGGIVATLVEITGASARGVLTADVSSVGAVSNLAAAFYIGETLQPGLAGGPPGTLTAIDDARLEVSDLGDVFFLGTASGGGEGIWYRPRTGTDVAVAVTGDPIQGGDTVGFTFNGFAIDGSGAVVVFAAAVTSGGEALIVRDGSTLFLVAKDGNAPPNVTGRTFADVFDDGTMVVTNTGVAAFVAWTGTLTGSAPNRGIFLRQALPVLGAYQTIAAGQQGFFPSSSSSQNGVISGLSLLEPEPNVVRFTYVADVSVGTTTRAVVSWQDGSAFLTLFGQGSSAPGGSTFTASYPSLVAPARYPTDDAGSIAFTATLADASSGVFWGIIGGEFLPIVKLGDTAPGTGGGTFGSFGTSSTVVTATGVVAFRSAMVGGTAASGLFRQF